MGNLTVFLQRKFVECCPAGWECRPEVSVLSRKTATMLGFAPRADVLLSKRDGTRQLWIEFEISRADPVANHAKFMTAQLFEPKSEAHVFVAMMSAHIDRGRHNLAAASVHVMRHVGMRAFQTVLFPAIPPDRVKALNHLRLQELVMDGSLVAQGEVERAISISSSMLNSAGHQIHFAANLFEVMLNVRQWNDEICYGPSTATWGNRTVVFFVHDRVTHQFAPAKFCAFVPIPDASHSTAGQRAVAAMTMSVYGVLDETETRFDGAVARQHLVKRLGMNLTAIGACAPEVQECFASWLGRHTNSIRVHPRGASIISAPPWWR